MGGLCAALERPLPAAVRVPATGSTASTTTSSTTWRAFVACATEMWLARPAELKALDALREADPHWYQSHRMVGAMCYVDLFAGESGGAARADPLPDRARHHLPAPDAAVQGPGGRQRRRLRGQQLPRGQPGAGHHGGAGGAGHRAAPPRHLVWCSTSSSTTPRTSTSGRGAPWRATRSIQEYYRMFPDREMPDAFERSLMPSLPG